MNMPIKKEESHYRPNVGIMLINQDNKVFVGNRIDQPNSWQMPQGGIDEGEKIETAAIREMEEEVGTNKAEIIGIMPDWQYYDFPENLGKRLWEGQYRGQRQKWVALRFTGNDQDINLDAFHEPEFSEWKWVDLDVLVEMVVPFKRDVYQLAVDYFKEHV